MFEIEESPIGYNPAFVAEVWRKRRIAKEAARKAEILAQKLLEKQQRKALYEARQAEQERRRWTPPENYQSIIDDALACELDNIEAPPTVRSIIEHHAKQSAWSYAEIIGPRRHRSLVAVRQKAMADAYVLRPDMSLPQLGKAFGNRDHTTVLHAIQKHGVWRRA